MKTIVYYPLPRIPHQYDFNRNTWLSWGCYFSHIGIELFTHCRSYPRSIQKLTNTSANVSNKVDGDFGSIVINEHINILHNFFNHHLDLTYRNYISLQFAITNMKFGYLHQLLRATSKNGLRILVTYNIWISPNSLVQCSTANLLTIDIGFPPPRNTTSEIESNQFIR